MTDVAFATLVAQITEVLQNNGGRNDEIFEAGMLAAHKAPQQPETDNGSHHVARPNVLGQEIVFSEIGNKKCQHQGPMTDPYNRVPDFYRIWCRFHVPVLIAVDEHSLSGQPCCYND